MKCEQNHYTLRCLHCGKEYVDAHHEGFLLNCNESHPPSLLRAQYAGKYITQDELPGLFQFAHWLPIRRILGRAPKSSVFQSHRLGEILGLRHLFIIFNGYWPEKDAMFETCTFKELEAPVVCARTAIQHQQVLVVASAGNTARAFLQVCSENEIPAVVVVPECALASLWLTREKHPCVKIVVVTEGADYYDAIFLGRQLASLPGYAAEGGAKNVARRDGMGTALLSGADHIGRIPDHYFQAVGSGTGGIAAWEMSRRLREDPRFGATNMRLHLSQSIPFTPMTDAWQQGSRTLFSMTEQEQKTRIQAIHSHVLSNRNPPYSLVGGVYDALHDSRGAMYAVSNEEAERAGAIFLQEEGCDLDPAAEVAFASLFQAVEMGSIDKQDVVMLNVTGGGYTRLRREKKLRRLRPDITVSQAELGLEDVAVRLHQALQNSQTL